LPALQSHPSRGVRRVQSAIRPDRKTPIMTLIKLLTAPFRRLLHFSPIQFIIVVGVILLLEYQDNKTIGGVVYGWLDSLVTISLDALARVHEMRSFTRSFLTVGLMIAYGYLVLWLILELARRLIRRALDFAGRENLFGLRNMIARERGIEAYRAWEPLEKIRPDHIPQATWERQFAWPADDRPPYPSLWRRFMFGTASWLIAITIISTLLQIYTPIHVVSWAASGAKSLLHW
jgi:hypothetical protein